MVTVGCHKEDAIVKYAMLKDIYISHRKTYLNFARHRTSGYGFVVLDSRDTANDMLSNFKGNELLDSHEWKL